MTHYPVEFLMGIRTNLRTILLVLLVSSLALYVPNSFKVRAAATPLAAFTYVPCLACAIVGDLVFFNGNWSVSPSGPIVLYTWNFGDGTTANTTSPGIAHDYLFPGLGIWQVILTVKDSSGQTGTVSQLVVFVVIPQFSYQPRTPLVGQAVLFNASSSVVSGSTSLPGFQWSFGDGAGGSGNVVVHSYSAAGLYRIVLTMVTIQGNPQISKTVAVSPPPAGSLVFSQTLTLEGVTLSVFGSLVLDTTAKTLSGTVSIEAVNRTTGAIISFRTYSISLSLGAGTAGTIKFVMAVPTAQVMLGVACTVPTTGGAVTCGVSRNPDLNWDRIVDIVDFSKVAFAYGSSLGSPRYDPAADLDADGTINIIDVSIVAYDYGATVFY